MRDFGEQDGFWEALGERAACHQLTKAVARALPLAETLYNTPADGTVAGRVRAGDRLYFPPLTLARHLWTK